MTYAGLADMYTYISLVAAGLLHLLRDSGAQAEVFSTSASLLMLLCNSNSCRNGECYVVHQSTRCVCEAFYRGDNCEYVNLDEVRFLIIGTLVIFQWQSPPTLSGYSFVYYESNSAELVLYKRDIFMKDNENTVIVGNLKGGHTLYRICIEDQVIAERALSTQSVEILTNCVELSTQTDYNTLAGWVLAGLLSVTIVLLMYSQRDKIEILYFNTPVYIPKALQDSLASHDVTNMTMTSEMQQRVSNGTTSVTSSGR